MANKLLGEAGFTLDGVDYTLRYDTEAILEIEDRLDTDLFSLITTLQAAEASRKPVKIGTMATILQCGLLAHHRGITRAEAADMLLSGEEAQAAIGEALSRAMPGQEGGGTDADPPKAPTKKSARK